MTLVLKTLVFYDGFLSVVKKWKNQSNFTPRDLEKNITVVKNKVNDLLSNKVVVDYNVPVTLENLETAIRVYSRDLSNLDLYALENFLDKYPSTTYFFEEESLFTHGFGKDVVKIIGENKGKDFRKYPMKKRKEIVERLEKLVENEVLWKDLVRNSMFDFKKITDKIFKLETMQFKEIYEASFYTL